MSQIESRGRFVWHDLIVDQVAEAIGFYHRTIGWDVDRDLENGTSIFRRCREPAPLGGLVQPCGVRSAIAPAWLPYVAISDVDATCRQAESLGGSVVVQPESHASGTVCAILSDPQGVRLGVVTMAALIEPEDTARIGGFSWHELTTTDCRGALEYYGALFGWEGAGQYERCGAGMYYLFGRRGRVLGGIQQTPPDVQARSAWLSYVRVENIRISADRTSAFGGSVSVPPTEVPGGDWVMVAADPLGTTFAVHEVTQA